MILKCLYFANTNSIYKNIPQNTPKYSNNQFINTFCSPKFHGNTLKIDQNTFSKHLRGSGSGGYNR